MILFTKSNNNISCTSLKINHKAFIFVGFACKLRWVSRHNHVKRQNKKRQVSCLHVWPLVCLHKAAHMNLSEKKPVKMWPPQRNINSNSQMGSNSTLFFWGPSNLTESTQKSARWAHTFPEFLWLSITQLDFVTWFLRSWGMSLALVYAGQVFHP